MSNQQQTRRLVYGEVNDHLIFVPEAEALRLATYWVLQSARTWDEFCRLAPDGVYDIITQLFTDGEAGPFEKFFQGLRREDDGVTQQLQFERKREKELVAAFERDGYECRRNQDLVWWASGGRDSNVNLCVVRRMHG
jgi:hypothetical protein